MHFQKLDNLKNESLNKKIFFFITKNLKDTIFNLFGYKFFRTIYLENNYKNIFFYNKGNQLLILISYINPEFELKLKKQMIKYLLLHPIKIFLLLKNIKFLFKSSKNPKNYIQLLHFIIDKSIITKINKIFRDNKINGLHKKFISKKYRGIYAAYSNENIAAKKYYKRNKFTIYNKNLFFCFVKKKFI